MKHLALALDPATTLFSRTSGQTHSVAAVSP